MIVTLYASLLAPLFVFLSMRTIRSRRKNKIPLGHADNAAFIRVSSVHANFAEYVPFALFLIFLAENSGADSRFVHIWGTLLFCGRCLHAYGVSQENENFKFRVAGMISTFFVLMTTSVFLLKSFFMGTTNSAFQPF